MLVARRSRHRASSSAQRATLLSLLLALFTATALVAAPNLEDERVAARRSALDLAGAWANDGFLLRDGHWSGALKIGAAKVLQVNLYAGNQYWFTLAATSPAKKVAVSVFDSTGKHVATEPYEAGARAAAGFAPTLSGPYYLKIEQIEGEPSAFALVYSYK